MKPGAILQHQNLGECQVTAVQSDGSIEVTTTDVKWSRGRPENCFVLYPWDVWARKQPDTGPEKWPVGNFRGAL